MSVRMRNLSNDVRWAIENAGVNPGVLAKKVMVYKTSTAAPYVYWSARGGGAVDSLVGSLATAEAALTTGRNDTILLTPEAHLLDAAFTWDLNCSHLIGMAPSGQGFSKRARVGMSTAFTPMITVSGYGNTFSNIYTQHGTATADFIGWLISGTRNVFNGVHFAGPMVAGQGTSASYVGVHITESENTFNQCIFGSSGIHRDQLTPNVKFTQSGGKELLTTFNDCLFILGAIDTDPYFIQSINADGVVMAMFNNCKFICLSTNNSVKAAVACTVSGAASAATYLCFDPQCQFFNVSLPVVAAMTARVHQATMFASATDEVNQIAINSAT